MTIKPTADREELRKAFDSEDKDTVTDAIVDLVDKKTDAMLSDMMDEESRKVLAGRGVRQLTPEEKAFYNKIIEAGKSDNFKDAVTNIDPVLPDTVIDAVFEDIEQTHALLSHLDIQRVNAKIKVLYTAADTNEATWGKLTDNITKEISESFEELDASLLKLSAYIPVPNAYLDLGPAYLDRLTRTFLYEALAKGLEKAVVTNLKTSTGPIAMTANMDGGTTTSGVTTYTAKTAIAVTEWTPSGLKNVMKALAKTRKGNPRPLNGLFCVVNPTDYYTLVAPAVKVQNASGDWVDRQPYPITFVQSAYVTSGQAIMGLDGRYILGVSSDAAGQIEYSDQAQFLDDARVYRIKLYGNGQPKDNNAFALLNISNLKPAALLTTTVNNTVNTGS